MEAFLLSTGIVTLAEMGDKTQLLSLVLAARFRKPWPIAWGILVAAGSGSSARKRTMCRSLRCLQKARIGVEG